jgi:hypothetical protein
VVVHQGIDSMELRLLGSITVVHRGRKYPVSQKRSPYRIAAS